MPIFELYAACRNNLEVLGLGRAIGGVWKAGDEAKGPERSLSPK